MKSYNYYGLSLKKLQDALKESTDALEAEADIQRKNRKNFCPVHGSLRGYSLHQLDAASAFCRYAYRCIPDKRILYLTAIGLMEIHDAAVNSVDDFGESIDKDNPILDALSAIVRYLRTNDSTAVILDDMVFFAETRELESIDIAYHDAVENRGKLPEEYLNELYLILKDLECDQMALRIRLMIGEMEQMELQAGDSADSFNTGTFMLGVLDGGVEGMPYKEGCRLCAHNEEGHVWMRLYRFRENDKATEEQEMAITSGKFFAMTPEQLCAKADWMMQNLELKI